jgi:hypothetical protein
MAGLLQILIRHFTQFRFYLVECFRNLTQANIDAKYVICALFEAQMEDGENSLNKVVTF